MTRTSLSKIVMRLNQSTCKSTLQLRDPKSTKEEIKPRARKLSPIGLLLRCQAEESSWKNKTGSNLKSVLRVTLRSSTQSRQTSTICRQTRES